MSKEVRSLDRLEIASPCEADWNSMIGNDQVRFCEHCQLQVTDLSTMTRQQAMRLVARSAGRLCVRYVARPDGSALHRQIPQPLYHLGRRATRIAAGAFSAALSVTAAVAQTRTESAAQAKEPASISQTNPLADHGATLSGVVKDPSGAVVPGALLTLTSTELHTVSTLTAADDGTYRFSQLDAGAYQLVAERQDFAKAEATTINLRPNAERSLDLVLKLPEIKAEVQVVTEPVERFVVNGGVGFRRPEDPLVAAAAENNLEAVKLAISTSPDPNIRDKASHTTALIEAVQRANLDILHLLLSAGADARIANEGDRTPLMYLNSQTTPDLVKALLAAGAEVNAKDESGGTALMNAAADCNATVVQELLRAGAEIAPTDAEGKTALMFGVENDDPRVAKLLIEAGAAINTHAENGQTALMLAAAHDGSAEALLALINAGAELNAKDTDGQTALMAAAMAGNAPHVKLLLHAGADAGLTDKEGKTALAHARAHSEEEVIQLLQSYGAPE